MTADVQHDLRRMSARHAGEGAAEKPQAATLYLALFLALLAFFLFLTSISTFDPARAVSVIESVEARFAQATDGTPGPETVQPFFAGPATQRIVADAGFTAVVADAFAEIAPDQGLSADVPGVVWHGARLSPDVMFIRNTAALSAAGREAVEAAASAMGQAGEFSGGALSGSATGRRMDVAVGGDQVLALKRAVAIAALVAAQAGPEAVSLRTMPTSTDIELVFYAVETAGGRS